MQSDKSAEFTSLDILNSYPTHSAYPVQPPQKIVYHSTEYPDEGTDEGTDEFVDTDYTSNSHSGPQITLSHGVPRSGQNTPPSGFRGIRKPKPTRRHPVGVSDPCPQHTFSGISTAAIYARYAVKPALFLLPDGRVAEVRPIVRLVSVADAETGAMAIRVQTRRQQNSQKPLPPLHRVFVHGSPLVSSPVPRDVDDDTEGTDAATVPSPASSVETYSLTDVTGASLLSASNAELDVVFGAALAQPLDQPLLTLEQINQVCRPLVGKHDIRRREGRRDKTDMGEHALAMLAARAEATGADVCLGAWLFVIDFPSKRSRAEEEETRRALPFHGYGVPRSFVRIDRQLRELVRAHMAMRGLSQAMVSQEAGVHGGQVWMSKWLNWTGPRSNKKGAMQELAENEDRLRVWLQGQEPVLLQLSHLDQPDDEDEEEEDGGDGHDEEGEEGEWGRRFGPGRPPGSRNRPRGDHNGPLPVTRKATGVLPARARDESLEEERIQLGRRKRGKSRYADDEDEDEDDSSALRHTRKQHESVPSPHGARARQPLGLQNTEAAVAHLHAMGNHDAALQLQQEELAQLMAQAREGAWQSSRHAQHMQQMQHMQHVQHAQHAQVMHSSVMAAMHAQAQAQAQAQTGEMLRASQMAVAHGQALQALSHTHTSTWPVVPPFLFSHSLSDASSTPAPYALGQDSRVATLTAVNIIENARAVALAPGTHMVGEAMNAPAEDKRRRRNKQEIDLDNRSRMCAAVGESVLDGTIRQGPRLTEENTLLDALLLVLMDGEEVATPSPASTAQRAGVLAGLGVDVSEAAEALAAGADGKRAQQLASFLSPAYESARGLALQRAGVVAEAEAVAGGYYMRASAAGDVQMVPVSNHVPPSADVRIPPGFMLPPSTSPRTHHPLSVEAACALDLHADAQQVSLAVTLPVTMPSLPGRPRRSRPPRSLGDAFPATYPPEGVEAVSPCSSNDAPTCPSVRVEAAKAPVEDDVANAADSTAPAANPSAEVELPQPRTVEHLLSQLGSRVVSQAYKPPPPLLLLRQRVRQLMCQMTANSQLVQRKLVRDASGTEVEWAGLPGLEGRGNVKVLPPQHEAAAAQKQDARGVISALVSILCGLHRTDARDLHEAERRVDIFLAQAEAAVDRENRSGNGDSTPASAPESPELMSVSHTTLYNDADAVPRAAAAVSVSVDESGEDAECGSQTPSPLTPQPSEQLRDPVMSTPGGSDGGKQPSVPSSSWGSSPVLPWGMALPNSGSLAPEDISLLCHVLSTLTPEQLAVLEGALATADDTQVVAIQSALLGRSMDTMAPAAPMTGPSCVLEMVQVQGAHAAEHNGEKQY